MATNTHDVVVLRKGTEGLSTESYAEEIRERLPNHSVGLARTPKMERELVRDARVVTGNGIDGDLLSRAQNLQLFVATSSGCSHLPLDELKDRGVAVVNAAGIHAPGIAEQVIGWCLVFARELHEGWYRKQNREWRHYQAGEFTDSTVTVVGLGQIGQAIVQRLQGFEVETIGVRYTPSKGGPTDEVIGFDPDDFHEALARTDYLIIASPLTDTTRGLIGSAELATLPPEAVLINVARGAIVDTDALLKAIQNESVRGASLDVTDPEPLPADHPLWNMGNVFITPHMGGHTPKHWSRLADIVATNVEHLDAGSEFDGYTNLVVNPAD